MEVVVNPSRLLLLHTPAASIAGSKELAATVATSAPHLVSSASTIARARSGRPSSSRGFKPSLASSLCRPEALQCGAGVRCSRSRAMAAAMAAAVAVAMAEVEQEAREEASGAAKLLRPSPAEGARTVMEVCVEGTLSTLSEEGWPLGTEVRFAVDMEGNPVLRLQPAALHTQHLLRDSRCSLHVQLEQPGRRKPQCTLRGHIVKVEDIKLKERLDIAWERRFGKEQLHDDALYTMNVEQALQSQDMGEEEIWVSGADYRAASADPLRECAKRIVEDMNRNHWEDIRRFCNVYARLDAELEEASMTWVDRLGFDLRVLTKAPQNILEIRIPFSREVADERDARSSLTIMAQIAWEHERNIAPTETVLATVEV